VTPRQMAWGFACVLGLAILAGYEAHAGHEWNALVFGLAALACCVAGAWAQQGEVVLVVERSEE